MSAREELLARLADLENLNPELSLQEKRDLFALAATVGTGAFDEAAAETARIIGLYLNSPVKRLGKDILAEYFIELERGERLLAEAGEIAQPVAQSAGAHSVSSALVRYTSDALSCLDRCKVLNRTEVPQGLARAADAFRRRLAVVDTVLELCFQVLWHLDAGRCQQWFLDYLDSQEGDLDPDVLRDMMRVVLDHGAPRRELLRWAAKWSADESLQEYWPHMIEFSDRLLCRESLKVWQTSHVRGRSHFLAHLSLLVRQGQLDDEHLLNWERQALEGIGECVQRFMDASTESADGQGDEEWHRTLLFGELQRISGLLRPILFMADQLLREPDGTTCLAMVVLGLAGEGLERWEAHILKLCERAVLRAFLVDLREGRTPVETIRRLTFGDSEAFNHLCAELDLLTQRFDSLKQRDKVVSLLAVYYASYRRTDLLGAEVTRRYRNLRRLLHEDYWHGHLDEAQSEKLQHSGILRDFDSLTAAARKFLDRRRAPDASVEEMVASKMEFERYVRQLRLTAIKETLAAN